MAASDMKSLPAQARKRIETLESTVQELTGAFGQMFLDMRRQGMDVAVPQVKSPLLRSAFQKLKPPRKPGLKGVVRVSKPVAKAAPATVPGGLDGALARGEAARVEWVRTGEVVPAKTLADKWGLTPQALGPAADRGEVFAVVVKRQRYYPKEFLDLDRARVAAVAQALNGLSPEEKLIFWKRPHGALGGRTVMQFLAATAPEAVDQVTQLAQSWASQAQAEGRAAEAA